MTMNRDEALYRAVYSPTILIPNMPSHLLRDCAAVRLYFVSKRDARKFLAKHYGEEYAKGVPIKRGYMTVSPDPRFLETREKPYGDDQ